MKSKFPNDVFGSCQSFHLHLLYSFPGNLIFFHTFPQTYYFPRRCSFPTSWPCQTPTHPLNTHSNKISSVKPFLTLGTTNRDSCFFFCFHISSIVFIMLFIFLWLIRMHTEMCNLNMEMNMDKRGNQWLATPGGISTRSHILMLQKWNIIQACV